MPRFPSPEWVAAADAALAADTTLAERLGEVSFSVGFVVEGEPPTAYRLDVHHGEARMCHGIDHAPVVLRADPATARAVHRGTLAAQDALMGGKLRVEGSSAALIANLAVLEVISGVLDGLRSEA